MNEVVPTPPPSNVPTSPSEDKRKSNYKNVQVDFSVGTGMQRGLPVLIPKKEK